MRCVHPYCNVVVGAETGFQLLTGLGPGTLELPPPFSVPTDVAGAIASARTQRPDVQRLR